MKKELFDELLESVHEGAAVLRGKRAPSRSFRVEEPGVKVLRDCHPEAVLDIVGNAQRVSKP